MQQPARWILRNVARRPVEIHGASGVTIVPASGAIEVGELDAQCLALVRQGVFTCHPAPPPASAPEAPADADAEAAADTSMPAAAAPKRADRRRRTKPTR